MPVWGWVTAGVIVALAITGGAGAATLSAPHPGPAAASPAPDTTATATPAATAAGDGDADPVVFTGRPTTVADASVTDNRTALEVLATLTVKGRAPKTGYTRDQFGQRWLDVDRNGCDTRNDILARDLTGIARPGGCRVLTGTLADPYTATTIDFVRGQDTSARVQIDHVVALSDAWQKGAQQLTADQRATFANDPLNLLAVDGPANAQKSDGDAATWLPRNKAFRCTYVARQVSVKATYGLWVTQAEHDAIARVLAACPDEKASTSAYATPAASAPAPTEPVPAPSAPAEPAAPPAEPAPAPPAPAAPSGVFYANCTAVRAAGAAPIRAGDPGYSYTLDRDRDGIACE